MRLSSCYMQEHSDSESDSFVTSSHSLEPRSRADTFQSRTKSGLNTFKVRQDLGNSHNLLCNLFINLQFITISYALQIQIGLNRLRGRG